MKQNTRIALAGLLSATGAALHALAEEISSASPSAATDKPEAAPEPAEPAEAPKPKRAPKAEKAAPAPAPTPEPESAPAPTEEKPADPAPTTDEETQEAKDARYQANRAMIQPFVQNPNWTADKRAALKGILAKLSPTTGALVDLPLSNQEAFERDFEALTL
jgi:outer membrane biosynthesis protein TonB